MKTVSLVCVLWFLLLFCDLCPSKDVEGGMGNADFQLRGPNVCVDQREEHKVINITYLQSQDVKEYTWCLKVPPR